MRIGLREGTCLRPTGTNKRTGAPSSRRILPACGPLPQNACLWPHLLRSVGLVGSGSACSSPEPVSGGVAGVGAAVGAGPGEGGGAGAGHGPVGVGLEAVVAAALGGQVGGVRRTTPPGRGIVLEEVVEVGSSGGSLAAGE